MANFLLVRIVLMITVHRAGDEALRIRDWGVVSWGVQVQQLESLSFHNFLSFHVLVTGELVH